MMRHCNELGFRPCSTVNIKHLELMLARMSLVLKFSAVVAGRGQFSWTLEGLYDVGPELQLAMALTVADASKVVVMLTPDCY